MDWEKYNKVPEKFATAREIGLAAATLGAMARRGLVEVKDTSPKQYRKLLVGLTNVVETQMCAQTWDKIEFGKVPSLAHSRYKRAFAKHQGGTLR